MSLFDEPLVFNRRRHQVNAIVAYIMLIVGRHIPDDGSSRRHAMEDLSRALYNAGADIITEDDRARAGLPPRGPSGWTDQELAILEAQRVHEMLKLVSITLPIDAGIVPIKTQKAPAPAQAEAGQSGVNRVDGDSGE